MVTHMKTTIEIADPLLEEARQLARTEGTTLRELVEQGLRVIVERRRIGETFTLRDVSFGAEGLQAGLDWSDWRTMRELAYEGRGG